MSGVSIELGNGLLVSRRVID